MRFSLRTLLIFMLLAGPLCAFGWQKWRAYQESLALKEENSKWLVTIQRAQAVRTTSTNCFLPPSEIWLQQRDKITWESFPESTPATP
jgi:hypothetical protein